LKTLEIQLKLYQLYIPVPSVCDVTRDLKDSNGNYTKSVCTMYQDKTYDAAVTACTANNMDIFNADSVDTENAMVSYSNVQWPYGNFWVEGSTCTANAYFHCEYQGENDSTEN
jgi:hypothetical protein